jgi:hypothetical protein
MDGVERLALVSKILFDVRLLELKRENEALKLKLFWKDHNDKKLNAAMTTANNSHGGPACSCSACAVSRRYLGESSETKPCTFKPWFEQVLEENGMSIARGLPDVPIWVKGSVVDSPHDVLDDGHHFSNLESQNWFFWKYGSKLWKATSALDPELMKLERLFQTLNSVDEDAPSASI